VAFVATTAILRKIYLMQKASMRTLLLVSETMSATKNVGYTKRKMSKGIQIIVDDSTR
jgi:hypothetical protein